MLKAFYISEDTLDIIPYESVQHVLDHEHQQDKLIEVFMVDGKNSVKLTGKNAHIFHEGYVKYLEQLSKALLVLDDSETFKKVN